MASKLTTEDPSFNILGYSAEQKRQVFVPATEEGILDTAAHAAAANMTFEEFVQKKFNVKILNGAFKQPVIKETE